MTERPSQAQRWIQELRTIQVQHPRLVPAAVGGALAGGGIGTFGGQIGSLVRLGTGALAGIGNFSTPESNSVARRIIYRSSLPALSFTEGSRTSIILIFDI